jgi:hypothetical protein
MVANTCVRTCRDVNPKNSRSAWGFDLPVIKTMVLSVFEAMMLVIAGYRLKSEN